MAKGDSIVASVVTAVTAGTTASVLEAMGGTRAGCTERCCGLLSHATGSTADFWSSTTAICRLPLKRAA